jgi:hypothetical protein
VEVEVCRFNAGGPKCGNISEDGEVEAVPVVVAADGVVVVVVVVVDIVGRDEEVDIGRDPLGDVEGPIIEGERSKESDSFVMLLSLLL